MIVNHSLFRQLDYYDRGDLLYRVGCSGQNPPRGVSDHLVRLPTVF